MFKQIESLPTGYEINEDGIVMNIHGKILSNTDTNSCGYTRICIRIKQQLVRKLLHRIVAIAHIDNPENKRCVNHIDGNKNNNSASNLEWVTDSENMKHAIKNRLCVPNTKPMIEHNRKFGSWNKGLKTGNQYTKKCV